MPGADIRFKVWNQTHLNLDQDELEIIPLLYSHASTEQMDVCEICEERLYIFIVIYNDFDAR